MRKEHIKKFTNLLFLTTLLHVLPLLLADWSPWNAWSLCYEQNGIWAQTRTRAWLGDPSKNPGGDMQAKACLPASSDAGKPAAYMPAPPPPPPPPPPQTPPSSTLLIAQADWTPWTEWSECHSVPDGSSPPFRSRWRICDRRKCDVASAANSGASSSKVQCQLCNGEPMEQQNCAVPAPSAATGGKQHEGGGYSSVAVGGCQWSEWSNWSSCSTTCGNGVQIRMRFCPCSKCPDGPSQEEKLCYNLLPCESMAAISMPYLPPPPPPPPIWTTEALAQQNLSSIIFPGAFNPCNYCPPMYALPCYTCLTNLQIPSGK